MRSLPFAKHSGSQLKRLLPLPLVLKQHSFREATVEEAVRFVRLTPSLLNFLQEMRRTLWDLGDRLG